MNEEILASTAFQIVVNSFDANASVNQKCFRIKNLNKDEVVSFVSIWHRHSASGKLNGAQLVVAENLDEQVPEQYVAAKDKSITYYRNNNPKGLVYLETRVQSDEQGLQNIFTLRDSNFLDGSFDDSAGSNKSVAHLLMREAWTCATKPDVPAMPELLLHRAIEVLECIHPRVDTIPVRRFVRFAHALCTQAYATQEALDESTVNSLVGNSLWMLGLFPDDQWRRGNSDTQIRRRVELNARHSNPDIDTDSIEKAVEKTRFKGINGTPLSPMESSDWGKACIAFAKGQKNIQDIPYRIFEQLFAQDTKGMKLGDKVRAAIEHKDGSRLQELVDMDILDGLNSKSPIDADALLNAPPANEHSLTLADLLPKDIRRQVERLTAPRTRKFFNPATELIRHLVRHAAAGNGSSQVARYKLELAADTSPKKPSLGLFAFLFGPMLKQISEDLEDQPDAIELEISPALLTIQAPPQPPKESEHDSDDDNSATPDLIVWDSLAVKLIAFDSRGKSIDADESLEWAPESLDRLALMWILMADLESPLWRRLGPSTVDLEEDTETWIQKLLQQSAPLASVLTASEESQPVTDALLEKMLEDRTAFGSEVCAEGLSIASINNYVDAWSLSLAEARKQYVPDGAQLPPMEKLLGTDMLVHVGKSHRTMLPSHPLRLRWLASYLEASATLAVKRLSGETEFATSDGDQYLDWLESRTPHETPPVASGTQGQLLFAKSENGWFEEFDVLDGPALVDNSEDPAAIRSIASRIVSYLDAHPYKSDGLSVLIVLPTSDNAPAALLSSIARGSWQKLRSTLTIAAPKSRWESIARNLEKLGHDERSTANERFFPASDIAFIDFKRGDDLSSQLNDRVFDISIVTHVLQESIQCQENTEAPQESGGSFKPLFDRPAKLDITSGGSISVVMRPRAPDPQLESWGTLVVRGNRSRPVAPGQPENTDFVELRVNFENSAHLFKTLHECSHWVITLERHISREQIESIQAGAPSVLSMESDIGNNGLNTLIVSSGSGRELISARICRKLKRLVPNLTSHTDSSGLEKLANSVYDETRGLSPHLALKAMGTSRVMEEILGLAVARTVSEELIPTDIGQGLSAWLSLDEHLGWFEGNSSFRADMCRITFHWDKVEKALSVDFLVLEGKLRQVFDPHGIKQVQETMEFFRDILAGEESAQQDPVDGEMWRERILAAIESTAAKARTYPDAANGTQESTETSQEIPLDIRQQFRSRKFRLRSFKGLYSACMWELGSPNLEIEQNGDVTTVRSSNQHLIALAGSGTDSLQWEKIKDDLREHRDEAPNELAVGDSNSDVLVPEMNAPSQSNPSEMQEQSIEAPENTIPLAEPAQAVGMERSELRRIYQSILDCLATHGVKVTAALQDDEPIIEGPASILFKVRPGNGVDPKKVSEKGMALKLALALEQDQNVGFGIDLGYVTIDVPKMPAQRYYVEAGSLWKVWKRPETALAAPLGRDRSGNVVELNFSSPNSPHLLVGGTTGSGKSEALNTLLFGLVKHYTPQELRLMLVDPKGTEMLPFANSEHLEGAIGWDDADAIVLLKQAVDEMQRRYALFKAAGTRTLAEFNASLANQERLPWWLVVLDEYADLTHDAQAKKDIEQELKRLAQKARAAGIHLIIATQKPSAEVISTNLRSNLPAQLALRVKNSTESRVILDEAGAEVLNGKGDSFLKADGKLTRVQCAWVKPEDQKHALGK